MFYIDRVKPVIDHDMVLTGNGTGVKIEDEGDMMSVFEAVADEHAAR